MSTSKPPQRSYDSQMDPQSESAPAMGRVVSVLISALLHVGLGVLLLLAGLLLPKEVEPESQTPPRTFASPSPMSVAPMAPPNVPSPTAPSSPPMSDPIVTRDEHLEPLPVNERLPIDLDTGQDGNRESIVPVDGGIFPLPPGGALPVHTVFVIDTSGSMTLSLDAVKTAMARRVSAMGDTRTFHMVFFSDSLCGELPGGGLRPATEGNRVAASEYLDAVRSQSVTGRTDPTEALKRAFEVLAAGKPADESAQIFLLTDGQFDVEADRLIALLDRLNPDGSVAIHTTLYNYRSEAPESPNSPERVLKRIADRHHGEFVHVVSD